MLLGIDPKNDYAFKCVFGNQKRTGILIHLLNAVLQPSPHRRVVAVEIKNPFTDQVVLDEKLAVLDIKACDQSGRYFNIEMQMVVHPSVRGRFLFYWAKLFGDQLITADDYKKLQPAISIIFLDGILYPKSANYHLPFYLMNEETKETFSDLLEIHVLQLPNFKKSVAELKNPLEKWLFFLKNGFNLDPEQVPVGLQEPEIQEAVRILQMMTVDELERERYEAREKARRDAVSWKKHIERSDQKLLQMEQQTAQLEQQAEQQRLQLEQQAEQQRLQMEQQRQEIITNRQAGMAQGFISQIRLCEELLNLTLTPEEELLALPLEDLKGRVLQLRQQVLGRSPS